MLEVTVLQYAKYKNTEAGVNILPLLTIFSYN